MGNDDGVGMSLSHSRFGFDLMVVLQHLCSGNSPIGKKKKASSEISNIYGPITSKITTHTDRLFVLMAGN